MIIEVAGPPVRAAGAAGVASRCRGPAGGALTGAKGAGWEASRRLRLREVPIRVAEPAKGGVGETRT